MNRVIAAVFVASLVLAGHAASAQPVPIPVLPPTPVLPETFMLPLVPPLPVLRDADIAGTPPMPAVALGLQPSMPPLAPAPLDNSIFQLDKFAGFFTSGEANPRRGLSPRHGQCASTGRDADGTYEMRVS
jgi:hypothetical protein